MAKRYNILSAGTTGWKSWQSLRKWDSEKHRSWNMPVVGFQSHVASDGSLFGVSGRWSACGWSVAQPDHLYPEHPFGALADFKTILEKEVRLFANSHVRHLVAWEPSF